MKKIDPIIIGIVLISLIVISGIILVAIRQQGPSISQYTNQDPNRPKLVIKETQFDFGKMNLSETKTKELVIKNIGASPLVLSDFITSCNCTFAQMAISGKESPKFSMHKNPNWRGEVLPNTEAVLKIIYEPQIMPVKGLVNREVVFKTNDPDQPLINIKFTAEVK